VLHGHRGRECGAPLRYRPVGASHSSTWMTHLLRAFALSLSRLGPSSTSTRPPSSPLQSTRRSTRPCVREKPYAALFGLVPASRTGSQLMKGGGPCPEKARVAISGMPAAHFTIASSVAAASLAVRGRRTVCAYLLEDLQGRPHRRLVAGDHRVLHGHRGRECGRSRCHCHVSARPRHRPDRRHRRSSQRGVRPGHACVRSPTRLPSPTSPP